MKNINVLEMQKGLYAIADGFKILANALDVTEEVVRTPIKEEIQVEKVEVVEEPKVEVEPVVEVEQEVQSDWYDRVSLEKMSYRELQQVAKDNDILATGKTEELLERILAEGSSVAVETEEVVEREEVIEEPVEEVIEEEVIEEEVEEEVEEEIEEEIEETEVVLTKADKIEQALEGYTEEDLADVLNSIGVSPKGKRQALLAKIVKAVEDNLLEIEIEEETGEVEEGVIETPEVEVDNQEEVEMTVARQRAVAVAREDVKKMIKDGAISEDQMNDILAYVYAGEEFSPALPLKEREEMLEEMYVNLVDDEGVSQELETPYERDGEYACCSKLLRKKANGNLECTVCEQEYMID